MCTALQPARIVSPRTQWASLRPANEMAISERFWSATNLVVTVLWVDGPLAYTATQNGWDTEPVWEQQFLSPLPPSEGPELRCLTQHRSVPLHVSPKHTVSILEITFCMAEQVVGMPEGQVLSSNPIQAWPRTS